MKIHNPPMKFESKEAQDSFEMNVKECERNQDISAVLAMGCCMFASEWATRMEKEIDQGAKVEDIAKRIFQEIDADEGITGMMYGMVVGILKSHWIHGEAFGEWHRKDRRI